MGDWQDRAIKELDDLDDRIGALEDFIAEDEFSELHISMQMLMFEQLSHMLQYSALLSKRLDKFYD